MIHKISPPKQIKTKKEARKNKRITTDPIMKKTHYLNKHRGRIRFTKAILFLLPIFLSTTQKTFKKIVLRRTTYMSHGKNDLCDKDFKADLVTVSGTLKANLKDKIYYYATNSDDFLIDLKDGIQYVMRKPAKYSKDNGKCYELTNTDRPKFITLFVEYYEVDDVCKASYILLQNDSDQIVENEKCDPAAQSASGTLLEMIFSTEKEKISFLDIKVNKLAGFDDELFYEGNGAQYYRFDKDSVLTAEGEDKPDFRNLAERSPRFVKFLLGRDPSFIDAAFSDDFY